MEKTNTSEERTYVAPETEVVKVEKYMMQGTSDINPGDDY